MTSLRVETRGLGDACFGAEGFHSSRQMEPGAEGIPDSKCAVMIWVCLGCLWNPLLVITTSLLGILVYPAAIKHGCLGNQLFRRRLYWLGGHHPINWQPWSAETYEESSGWPTNSRSTSPGAGRQWGCLAGINEDKTTGNCDWHHQLDLSCTKKTVDI